MTAFKKEAEGDGYIIRLFEPTGLVRKTKVTIPCADIEQHVSLQPFEVQTLRINMKDRFLEQVNLMETVETFYLGARE